MNAGSPGAATLMVYFVSHGTYCTITKRKGNQKWKKKWEEGKMERETRSRNKATTDKEHLDSYNLTDAVPAHKLSSGLHLKCPFYCDYSGLYICHIFFLHTKYHLINFKKRGA